jgi:hypothetical protein
VWEEALAKLTEWLERRSAPGDWGVVVTERQEDAEAMAARCEGHRVTGIGLSALAARMVRRGALSAEVPPGFVRLGNQAALELSSRMAARDARRRRSARVARGTLTRDDLEWALRRAERRRPELPAATLRGAGIVVAVLRRGALKRWRARLESLAEGPDPAEVWLAELPAPPRRAAPERGLEQPSVQELQQLAAALEEPSDLVAVLGVLRGRLFGLSDESLVRHRRLGGDWRPRRATQPSVLPGDPAVIEVLDQLARWGDLTAERGVVPVLESALEQLGQWRLLEELSDEGTEAAALRRALDRLHDREVWPLPDARPRAGVLEELRRGRASVPRIDRLVERAPSARWPRAPRLEPIAPTAPPSSAPGETGGAEFDLVLARQALEWVAARDASIAPENAAELVERVLRLSGRTQEDALRGSGIVRELWAHPLVTRARSAAVARTGLGIWWVEDPPADGGTQPLVRGVIDLWFEDEGRPVIAVCDSGAWRDPAGPDRRLEARRGDLMRIVRRLQGDAPVGEAWLLVVGGPKVSAVRCF